MSVADVLTLIGQQNTALVAAVQALPDTSALQSALDAANAQVAALQSQVSVLQSEIAQAQSDIAKAAADLAPPPPPKSS